MADKISRRNILKAFATTPVLGLLGASIWVDEKIRRTKQSTSHPVFEGVEQVAFPKYSSGSTDTIKVGIMGLGSRGEYLLRAAGYAHPDWIESRRKAAIENPVNTNLKDFLEQENLNIELVAVCDVFDVSLERGQQIAVSEYGANTRKKNSSELKVYTNYHDLLNNKDVDAVIIATPDHCHAQMTIDAVKAGKHVYQEKCFARTCEEAVQLYDVLSDNTIVYQLGHQNQQIESHLVAQNIIQKGLLGKVSIIQGSTRRNRSGLTTFHPEASEKTINWEAYQQICEDKYPFNLKRYFWWRNYFDYSIGQFGDLMSHEFAAINQIASLGIPSSVMTSGGIYIYKDDGRETPDTFASVLNYPEKNLTLNYNLTMGSTQAGGRYFIGKDATMEAEKDIRILPEVGSKRYLGKGTKIVQNPKEPIFSFISGKGVDAVTTATEKYFSQKGLYYTYRDGRLVDSTHLHIHEWLNCIRYGGIPSCDKELGFEEAIACIMASESYRQGQTVQWDPINRKIS